MRLLHRVGPPPSLGSRSGAQVQPSVETVPSLTLSAHLAHANALSLVGVVRRTDVAEEGM
jgi:hypothetical protein